jgi:hypothetical protein
MFFYVLLSYTCTGNSYLDTTPYATKTLEIRCNESTLILDLPSSLPDCIASTSLCLSAPETPPHSNITYNYVPNRAYFVNDVIAYSCLDSNYRLYDEQDEMFAQFVELTSQCQPSNNWKNVNIQDFICVLIGTYSTSQHKMFMYFKPDEMILHKHVLLFIGNPCEIQNNFCCSIDFPCQEGDGSCNEDSDCAGSLVCGTNNCPFGLSNLFLNKDCCKVQGKFTSVMWLEDCIFVHLMKFYQL